MLFFDRAFETGGIFGVVGGVEAVADEQALIDRTKVTAEYNVVCMQK